jgi:hypothetical protein
VEVTNILVEDTVNSSDAAPKKAPIQKTDSKLIVDEILIDDSKQAYQKGADYQIDTAYIVRGILLIKCSFSGGCKEHSFKLYTDKSVMKSLPPQMNFNLNHQSNDDPCEAWKQEVLRFNIDKSQLEENKEIVINLSNYKHKIKYKYGN